MLTVKSALPLVKRAVGYQGYDFNPRQGSAPVHFLENGQKILDEIKERLSRPGSVITLVVTFLAFFILSSLIEYAITTVAVNLAAVESTNAQPSAAPKQLYTDDVD